MMLPLLVLLLALVLLVMVLMVLVLLLRLLLPPFLCMLQRLLPRLQLPAPPPQHERCVLLLFLVLGRRVPVVVSVCPPCVPTCEHRMPYPALGCRSLVCAACTVCFVLLCYLLGAQKGLIGKFLACFVVVP